MSHFLFALRTSIPLKKLLHTKSSFGSMGKEIARRRGLRGAGQIILNAKSLAHCEPERQRCHSNPYILNANQHEPRDLAIIEAQDSEVRLEPYRETDGDGQGSGLSGEAESQFAGLRFARLAAAD